jgi:FdhD protein
MGRVTVAHRVHRLADQNLTERVDTLAAEEPLELLIDGQTIMVTMRTPGHDFDLVAGLLVAEGVIGAPDDLTTLRYCPRLRAGEDERYNTVEALLAPGVVVPEHALARVGYTTSACGVCGKTSVDAVCSTTRWPVADDPLRLAPKTLYQLPNTLRSAQRVFDRTGGLHAAGVFTPDGEPLYVREDVGRHNAVDKVVGAALRDGRLPLRGHVLAVSGRASFELVQKAVAAGIPALVAVSAPSALAVRLAADSGLTLAGFVRGTTANVYTRADRVEALEA